VLLLPLSPADAAAPGKAAGTVTINGAASPLALAALTTAENLFDSSKRDTLIVLSDRSLGDTSADDEIGLSMKARRGELTVVALRVDGSKLVNVTMSHKGLDGVVKLPGTWFQYAASAKGTGTLKLAKREWDGSTYECSAEFNAVQAPAPRPSEPEAPTAPPRAAPAPADQLPPPTTSNVDRSANTALVIQALMMKDEHQALELIKLGVDPNGKDQYGVPLLNWAVMTCQPKVVKALVDRKADLTYQRAPGMTIMTEAGACPAAAKILKAAGAK
jgi:hypothetical protein